MVPLRRILPFAVACGTALACSKTAAPDVAGHADGSTAASASTSASTTPGTPGTGTAAGARDGGKKDDEVRAVFPVDDKTPHPLAVALCSALHDLPATLRGTCCSAAPGTVVTSECVRTLTTALVDGTVTLAREDVDACAAALRTSLDGCAWVGPFPPALPAACTGAVRGTAKAGAECRSTLECAGTLRCRGIGPTTRGRCAGPQADDERCGGSVDPLATYLRLGDQERERPECSGYCNRFKCATKSPKDAPCSTSRECASGLECVAKKCVPRTPAKRGEKCPGGVCSEGLECILGTCTTKKAAGEACTVDFECVGGCVKKPGADAKAKGVCGMKCGAP
ncbi:MAG: hypothetical protein U0169_23830 [Polyangiaceae bacterium]